ncbi:MAG TPA: WbuC family cupin fold metalloprotein [Xanthobacteraceae bacterium]|jgi:cupin fold WbuC family metalloprotein|nr:WbuC family cupin fold metalloprotein [Xanthobacteraceae bacterium]
MSEVFHNDKPVISVSDDWVSFLKERAENSPLRRSRLCLHRNSDDAIHEMVIVMCKDVLFRPHRHRVKTESIHIIDGALDIILFDKSGTVEEVIAMGPFGSGRNFSYRLSVSQFHAVLPLSDYVVVYEVTMGPYLEGDAEFAPWAPADTDALRKFLIDSANTNRSHPRKSALAIPTR